MGYQPAANTTGTGTLTHLATVYYDRRGLDVLMKRLRFHGVCEPDLMPKRNGLTIQWFRYSVFSANTTPSAEGTVGTSLELTTTTVSATVQEYSDFITISTLLQDTAIDPIVENAAEMLSYRAALSVDTITRIEFDSAVASVGIATLGATLSVGDFRRARALLTGADVMPRDGDDFVGILHPYVCYDLESDNSAGGFIDISKYAAPDRLLSGEIGRVAGCRLVATTNVGTTGTAPNVEYYTYVVGKGAVGAVDLAGSGPSKIDDPKRQSFKINVVRGGPSIADPEGMIGAAVSYRYVYVVKILDSDTYRYRIIKADASLV